jgi:hypothetical protein
VFLFTPSETDTIVDTLSILVADATNPRKFDLTNRGLRLCIDGVVRQNIPGAVGEYVSPIDRASGYKEFGEMLHYRNRGFSRVDSLNVDWGGTAFATTEIASLGVLPVDVLHIKDLPFRWKWDAVDFVTQQRTYGTNKEFGKEISVDDLFVSGVKAAKSEVTAVQDMQAKLVRGVDACLQVNPGARVSGKQPQQ